MGLLLQAGPVTYPLSVCSCACFPRLFLELIFQSKLHLPRRSRVAGREASVGDNTKGRATNLRGPSGLPEVGVIEHVEDFPAEFDHLALTQLRALNQRQVCIVETWSNYHVSSQAAEMVDALSVYELHRQHYHRT